MDNTSSSNYTKTVPTNLSSLESGREKPVSIGKPKGTRRSQPKTRSGCKTCKIRRVKCGEEKPECQRCVKFGVQCDGYLPLRSRTNPPESRSVFPSLLPATLSIFPLPTLFMDEEEHQYFAHFRDEIRVDLSGPILSSVWNYVILRASHDETALRQLIIAIAALSKYNETSHMKGRHHEFALRHYGKALRRLREIANRPETDSLRIVLIASILIFCFENMYGSYDLAIKHMYNALRLLRKQFRKAKFKYSPLRKNVVSFPSLESDILDLYIKLDNALLASMSGRISVIPLLQIDMVDQDISMPHMFQNLVDARNHLQNYQYRWMPVLSNLAEMFVEGSSMGRSGTNNLTEEMLSGLQDWQRAFAPLFAQACSPAGKGDFVAAASLQILALATNLSMQKVCCSSAVMTPGAFDVEALEIVNLSRRLVSDKKFKKIFVLDCGVVPGLFATFIASRNTVIREEIIRILRTAEGRQEVVLDAGAVARACQQMLDTEMKDLIPAAFLQLDKPNGFMSSELRLESYGVSSDVQLTRL